MSIKLIITKSMNFCGYSTKHQRQRQMANINKLRGPIREFTVAVGAYSREGGLLTICSSRVGIIRGGLFQGGGGGSIGGFMVCIYAYHY